MEARHKAEQILRDLDFDFQAFAIEKFVSWISSLKGRQILTIPWDMPRNLFGAWLSDDDAPREYIFYRRDVPPIHQIHIQLHELAHLLFGHPTLRINRKMIVASLEGQAELPFCDLILLRSTMENEIEKEAETLASLIQEQVIQHAQLAQLTRNISSDERLAKIMSDMGLT